MIREGRAAGWLRLPNEALLPWAMLNDVLFERTVPGVIEGKGGALLAQGRVGPNNQDEAHTLLIVPKTLILSLERVQEHAKIDRDYREVLEALGDFGTRNLLGHLTPRIAIITFLLVQASLPCPTLEERLSVHTSFTDYVKFLPGELLPTFWSPEELALLVGTTLAPALSSKLRSLRREYDTFCERASSTRWYRLVEGMLNLDDWFQVDAMYRSRALDFPGVGHCMVPCVDLANHAADEETIAIYERGDDGNAVLLLRDGKVLEEGEEVTITYGDEKGACEMLFSYGFLEQDRTSAETVFLSLDIPQDDPYRVPKRQIADCAPGVKLIDVGDGQVDYTGEYIWLLCVNDDDGLHFKVARTVTGEEEVHAFFHDLELTGGAPQLYALLGKSELWDVYRLRAIAILQQRVFDQLQVLYSTQEEVEAVTPGEESGVREIRYKHIMLLRKLEFELLEKAYEDFEEQKLKLAESEVVKRYLAQMAAEPSNARNNDPAAADDFS